ncbi:FapA family protein [Bacillus sp. V3B]|uniref:flagellar assembly protein A n=1 Tax=Bacillus sp. V3B TaxID=2804915 RepID=UPI00210E5B7D|nr:FapA family protein [Bacillus sp. V3B]MCQ6275526.1 FapA family protein [Bacillus sp. V3B]
MQSIISKGKDITNAIELGLEILDLTKIEVNIEIIQSETKGFMGIGSKPAVVKLTKLESNSSLLINNKQIIDHIDLEQLITGIPDENIEQITTTSTKNYIRDKTMNEEIETDLLEGKVWVKNGQLFCKSSPTHFPMVTINNGIRLYKNNQLVKEKTTIISEKDLYQIKVESEEKETKWTVSIDKDKLKVHLHVEPGYKIIRNVPNIAADHHIELVVEETKEIHNSLNYTDVMRKLELLRVTHGFNQDEIVKALEVNEPSTFEIAYGQNSLPGKDGWIEVIVDMNTQAGLKEKEDGRIDFREIKRIPTVERGTIIAVVHLPIPGQLGYTVTNDPIPPKQTFPIVLETGNGIAVVEDKIVSTESGRPLIEQRGKLVKISNMPKLTYLGNVDLSTGNIHFVGDVEIFGEVEERMVVEAAGDICVDKSVNFAFLTASGAITTFGNIIGSELSAGKNNLLVEELGHLLGNIHQQVEKIISLIKQLTLSAAFKSSDFSRGGLQPLIRIILEKKFKNFPPLVKKYVTAVRRGENFLDDDDWREVSVLLTQLFLSLTNEITSLERIEQLSQKIKELHEFSKIPIESNSYITIPNAQNSSLYCRGNILILGQGCINTKIHAGGTLKINGILRGGEVYGRLGVEINEVGSESGTPTVITVPSDQKIIINKAMEGTIIKIGNVKHTLKDTRYRFNARLDENEKIVFEY